MSDDDDPENVDTLPPSQEPSEYDPKPNLKLLPPINPESLTPKTQSNILLRLDGISEYQSDMNERLTTLTQLVGELTTGMKSAEITRMGKMDELQLVLFEINKKQDRIEQRQERHQESLKNLGNTLEIQADKLNSVEDAVAGLQRDDANLRSEIAALKERFDSMAAQLAEESRARNGNK